MLKTKALRSLVPLTVVLGLSFAQLAFADSIPSVSTGTGSSAGSGILAFHATIDVLGGQDVTVRGFEYGLTTGYGGTTQEESALSPFGADPYSESVSGLTCGRTYHFRAFAASVLGPGYGEDATASFGCNNSRIYPTPPMTSPEPTADSVDAAVPQVFAPAPNPAPAPTPVPSPLEVAFPLVPPPVSLDAFGHHAAPASAVVGLSPFDQTPAVISQVEAGWLIRAPHYDSVYYVTNNLHRRPFLDAATFFTWAKSFDDVTWVTDATLATLPVDGPMLPHAGVVLVKIQDSPEVYVVEAQEDGSSALRLIPTASRAVFLFGANWAKYVIDLPPTIFHAFKLGADVNPYEMFSRSLMKLRSQLQ